MIGVVTVEILRWGFSKGLNILLKIFLKNVSICRHNEDGSYTYGFEGADGSFKIETKAQTGEVKGKYGYVDETGKVRSVIELQKN